MFHIVETKVENLEKLFILKFLQNFFLCSVYFRGNGDGGGSASDPYYVSLYSLSSSII